MSDYHRVSFPCDNINVSGSIASESSAINKRARRFAMDLITTIQTYPSCEEQKYPRSEEENSILRRMPSKRGPYTKSRKHAKYTKNDPYCHKNDHRPHFRTISSIWMPYNQDDCGASFLSQEFLSRRAENPLPSHGYRTEGNSACSASSRQSTLLRTLHHSTRTCQESSLYAAGSQCYEPSRFNPPQVRAVQDLLSSMPIPAIRCQYKELVETTDEKPKDLCEGTSVAGARTNNEDNADLPASILSLLEAKNKSIMGYESPAFGLPLPSPPCHLNAKCNDSSKRRRLETSEPTRKQM